MRLRNTIASFGIVHQVLHWGLFGLIIAQFVTEYFMKSLPKGAEKWWYYDLHKSLGITVLMLVVVRLGWRFSNPVPRPPAGVPPWQRRTAALSHGLLYTLLFMMPVAGFIGSKAGGYKASWFGLFEMPDLFGKDDGINTIAEAIHTYGSYAIYAIVGVHVAAALYHHVVLKDDVLRRMLPFGTPRDA